jgi:hypothetical protein
VGGTCNGHKDGAGDKSKSNAATANGYAVAGGAGKAEKADGMEAQTKSQYPGVCTV